MRLLLAVLVLSFALPAYAQEGPPPPPSWRGQLDVAFALGIPQGEFDQAVDGLGYGATIGASAAPQMLPVTFGIEGTFLTYGSDERTIPFPGSFVNVREVTTNNMALGHLFIRLVPPSGRLRPFLEGLGGMQYLWTESRLENERNDEDVFSSTNFDDFTWSAGVGGGLQLYLFTSEDDEGQPFDLNLLLGVRYFFGGTAEYLDEGDIELDEDNRPVYTPNESRTDLLVPMLGVSVVF